jgi:Flp pilus assembly pilin Flp
MTLLTQVFATLRADERGQDLIEYALLAGFLAVVVSATFPPIGNLVGVVFSRIGSVLELAQ